MYKISLASLTFFENISSGKLGKLQQRCRFLQVSVGMGRISAEDFDRIGKKVQLVESVLIGFFRRVGFNFHIKLRGDEFAADEIAFKFGNVDAVGGKTAEGFVKGGGNAFDMKNERSDEFFAVIFGNLVVG